VDRIVNATGGLIFYLIKTVDSVFVVS